MGKVRIKTIGDEELERQQEEEARKKAEAKRAEKREAAKEQAKKDESVILSERTEQSEGVRLLDRRGSEGSQKDSSPAKPDQNDKSQKTQKTKFAEVKKASHSQSYKTVSSKVNKDKTYTLKEALELLPELKRAKFDETVELHINTTERGVSGSVTFPHGTGKKVRVVIANASNDPQGVDELVGKIESGTIDFDVLIATPDSMPRLAKVAKILGPKGLMPNPKNNTVSPKPETVAKQFEAGQISFKTEAKAPIIHVSVGKVSFGGEKLSENIKAFMNAVPNDKIKNVTLKSTMSPGIRISA